MIKLISIAMLALLISCSKKPTQTALQAEQIDSLVNVGFNEFSVNPGNALKPFIRAGNAYEVIDSFNKAGDVFLNVAGIFEEYSNHLDSAMFFSKRSLDDYLKATDSTRIANLQKYYGYLLGMNGQLRDGKSQIQKAKAYYDRIGFEEGVAVCQYNLARLAFLEKDYSGCDSLLLEAKKVWIKNKNGGRLFLINLLLLEARIENADLKGTEPLLSENDSILQTGTLMETDKTKYQKMKERIQ